MAEDKDQLVDEGTMQKMSVAPPDPETEAQSSAGKGGRQPLDSDAIEPSASAGPASGVADQDPLSAHPS